MKEIRDDWKRGVLVKRAIHRTIWVEFLLSMFNLHDKRTNINIEDEHHIEVEELPQRIDPILDERLAPGKQIGILLGEPDISTLR